MNKKLFEIIPVTKLQQNCTLQICPDSHQAVVIDPGGDVKEILSAIERARLEVSQIWITHCHFDHIGGVAELHEQLQVPIYGPHIADQNILINANKIAHFFGFDAIRLFTPTRWLNDGELMTFGRRQFKVKHMPGHSPGHVIYIDEENQWIQMGDVLFRNSIGRTDLPGGNSEIMKETIKSLFTTLPSTFRFIAGHGPLSDLAFEHDRNAMVRAILAGID